MTKKTSTTGKKRKRLTLEEQIIRQQEILDKDREKLEKKEKRLRSLNASKMNKDRIQAQKKRNSMLIQLGLYFIEKINEINQESGFEFIDVKDDTIKIEIERVENKIKELEKLYKNYNNKETKSAHKYLNDKNILLEALK